MEKMKTYLKNVAEYSRWQILCLGIQLFLLLLVLVFMGCTASQVSQVEHGIEAVAALDSKTHSVLTTVEISSIILHKFSELHRAGVDQEIIDEIRDAMHEVHAITDKHHKEHIK